MDFQNMSQSELLQYLQSAGYNPTGAQFTYMTPEMQQWEFEQMNPVNSGSGSDSPFGGYGGFQQSLGFTPQDAYWQTNADLGDGQRGLFQIGSSSDGMGFVNDPKIYTPTSSSENWLKALGLFGAGLAGGTLAMGGLGTGAAGAAEAGALGSGVTVGGPMTFGNVAGAVTATDLGLLGAAGAAGAAGGSAGAAGGAAGSAGSSALGSAGTLGSVGSALGTAGQFVSDNKSLLGAGATALGGLLGAASGGDTTTAATQTRDPWAPAQPYLKENLQTNADLQKYYQQNPFNEQQKQSYNNIFSDINTFRGQTAPGLNQFANNAMTGSYQRPQLSAPGTAGYGSRPSQQGPGSGITGPFSTGQGGSYQMPDWLAMNPFKGK